MKGKTILYLFLFALVNASYGDNLDSLTLLGLNATFKNPGDVAAVTWEKCKDSSSKEYCMNCAVSITCVDPGRNHVAIAEWCPTQMSCNPDSYSICRDQPVSKCSCAMGVEYQLDPLSKDRYDESWYMKCNVNGYNLHYHCEDGYFDLTTNQCQYCPPESPIVSHTDCYHYVTCNRSTDGLFINHVDQTCPSGMFINDDVNRCITPAGSFQCFAEGDFKDPFDCQRYQRCSFEAVVENGLSTPICCHEDEVFIDGTGCVQDGFTDCSYTHNCQEDIFFCHGRPPPSGSTTDPSTDDY